jgi:hypothetical protein
MSKTLEIPQEGTFLRGELKKLSSTALECLIGHTWGFQKLAFEILIERGEFQPVFPLDESALRKNNESMRGQVVGMYVCRQDIPDAST